MAKGRYVEFTTTMDVKQSAQAFRELMESGRSGFGRIVGGITFEPPSPSDDAFDVFEKQPDFQVVAHCPRNRFNKYGGYGIHCYIYDEGERRRVVLGRQVVGHIDTPSADGTLDKVLQGFQQRDGSLRHTRT